MTKYQQSTIIRIGTTGDYKPYSFYFDDTREFIGFDIELIQLICNSMRLKFKFIQTSWPTLEADLENNLFDMAVGGIAFTQERKNKFLTTQTIIYDGKVAIVCQKNKGKINSLADIDLPNIKVIVNPGGTTERFVRDNFKQAQIIVYDNNNLIFDELAREKADVMVTDRIEAIYQQSIDQRLYVVNPHKLLTNETFGYLFSKNNLELRNIINNGFCEIKKTPELFLLYKKFFSYLPMMITVM